MFSPCPPSQTILASALNSGFCTKTKVKDNSAANSHTKTKHCNIKDVPLSITHLVTPPKPRSTMKAVTLSLVTPLSLSCTGTYIKNTLATVNQSNKLSRTIKELHKLCSCLPDQISSCTFNQSDCKSTTHFFNYYNVFILMIAFIDQFKDKKYIHSYLYFECIFYNGPFRVCLLHDEYLMFSTLNLGSVLTDYVALQCVFI